MYLFSRLVLMYSLLAVTGSSIATVKADNQQAEAFIRAVLTDEPKAISEMLKQGANVNQITGTGQSILCAASMLGKKQAVQTLINAGAELLDSCLVTAVANGQTEIAGLFLARGKSPNLLTGENGDTLLHMSVRSGYIEMVELLLTHGADPSLKNEDGQMPSEIVKEGITLLETIDTLLSKASTE